MNVNALVYDSRKAERGSAFFALKGADADGLDYASEAVEKGASVVICDRYDDRTEALSKLSDVSVMRVSDVRKALAEAASNFYGKPQDDIVLVGITGTKGKTTTALMIQKIFEEAGIKTGIIGTVVCGWKGHYVPSPNTTPQSLDIIKLLSDMRSNGCRAAVVEVSSQALMQSRVHGLRFDIAVYTNISPDHIGKKEHDSFEDYIYWKSRLFTQTKVAIINNDDSYSKYFKDKTTARKIVTYSVCQALDYEKNENTADYVAKKIEIEGTEKGLLGLRYLLGDEEIYMKLPGLFNVYNSLAAIAVASEMGIDLKTSVRALKDMIVRGRVEPVPTGKDFTVLVDYAHNGMALENLLTSLRAYKPARLIVVFGCGGGRDKNRRRQMGEAAARLADFSVVTSDNPRDEEPMNIIRDITSAMSEAGGSYTVIPDRREAIRWTVREAQSGDIIVVAGKGHETYQLIGGEKKYFDDREVILSVFEDDEI